MGKVAPNNGPGSIDTAELDLIHRYWQAANYPSVGQIYLLDNPLLAKRCTAPPDLVIRVVNVIDLMTLQPQSQHPHGLADDDFDALFTRDRPVIFAYHGYAHLIA